MTSPYRLAIVDLDDTLLGHDKQISPANLRALDLLRSAGIEVVVASGRHHLNIALFERHTQCQGWIISSAGAMVKHAVTSEVLQEHTLPPSLALEVYRRALDSGASVIAYHRDGIFMESESEWTRLDAGRSGHPPQLADIARLIAQGLQKLMWTTAPAIVDAIFPALLEEYRERLYVVHTESEMMEFLSLHANKATGAQVVAAKLGIAREQVIAFGDGNNDVPVLEWAGCSVAMDHGREAARRAARFVTPPGPHGEAFARAVDMVLN